ncbi:hypothetical protein H0H93_005742 [Arthromyces matolae]|nr:hypothetical protein H0H93_005742 [Arthromyces matolae]
MRTHYPFDNDYSDSDDDFDDPPVDFSPPLSVSSYTDEESMRSASPVPSVFSFSHSARAQAVRQEFGRAINNYSEVYKLPADDEELDRQGKFMWRREYNNIDTTFQANLRHVWILVAAVVVDRALDTARDFPHCQVVAVDLVPMQCPTMPSNCRSEVDDINLGLEHFYGDFNVVRASLISSGIKDFHNLVNQMTHCLRPGGLLILIEWGFDAYGPGHERLHAPTDEIDPPWLPRWLSFVKGAIKTSGGDVDASDKIWSWISEHPLLEDPVHEEFWMPVSPWCRDDETKVRMANTMKDDLCVFLRSGRPLLLGTGVPEDVVDRVQHNADLELQSAAQEQYLLIRRVCARKKR